MLAFGAALTPDSSPVRTVEAAGERSALCRRVLEALPDWFGLPDALERYVHDVASLPVLAVDDVGFLALKVHSDTAAEIYVMGVLPAQHRTGIGKDGEPYGWYVNLQRPSSAPGSGSPPWT